MSSFASKLNLLRWRVELRRTLKLALPIAGGMLGHMLLGIADTVMVGRVGVIPLAACSLVNTIAHVPMVIGFGLLVSVSVKTAQAFGARRPERAGDALKHGLALALAAGGAAALSMVFLADHLEPFRQPPDVIHASTEYMRLCGWSILPLMLYHAVKQFGEAVNLALPPMWIMWSGVALNIFLNWVLIFGNLGAPVLGLEGAGVATLAARSAMAAAGLLWLIGSRRLARWRPENWLGGWSLRHLTDLLRLGGPAAAQQGMEVGAFVGGGIMMGWFGANALAAHQIAITLASTTFVVALSIGMAVGVRVGHAWGAGLPRRLRIVTGGGILLGVGFMTCCAVLFFTAGSLLAGWFVDSPEVIGLAASLLLVAGFFQIADGTQVVLMFATRGMSDVRIPTLIALLAYWIIGLPVGYLSAFRFGQGPVGLWFGFAFGLSFAAVLLAWRFLVRSREASAST